MNNEAKKALADYAAAKKAITENQQEAVDARWRFLEQFFGDTQEEADAAFEILSHHTSEQHYREMKMLRDTAEKGGSLIADLNKRAFFGRLYEKFYKS